MNNVGALALLMPVAIQIAAQQNLPPGQVLMPLAFGSILGGMTTLIGTPPNLIVSGFRAENGGSGFAMFDFAPVGLAVAVAGVLHRAGRLAARAGPQARAVGELRTGAYLTEAVPEKAKAAGKTLREIEQAMDETDAQVVGLVRNEVRVPAPHPTRRIPRRRHPGHRGRTRGAGRGADRAWAEAGRRETSEDTCRRGRRKRRRDRRRQPREPARPSGGGLGAGQDQKAGNRASA